MLHCHAAARTSRVRRLAHAVAMHAHSGGCNGAGRTHPPPASAPAPSAHTQVVESAPGFKRVEVEQVGEPGTGLRWCLLSRVHEPLQPPSLFFSALCSSCNKFQQPVQHSCLPLFPPQVGELRVMWVTRSFKAYLDVTEDARDTECLKTEFSLLRSVSWVAFSCCCAQ
jgi:hypothetical protein